MAGVWDGFEELFDYNRENFMFDGKMKQEREYQEQDMRVKQFMLYREDVRDLTELTTGKMDSYLLIAMLELGCCLDMLMHGVLHVERGEDLGATPDWMLWLYVISLAEAFVYLFLSAWLAIHASVSAHSFSVRLLTQFVRLPLPGQRQLDAATSTGTEYERSSALDLIRVPVWQRQAERLAPAPGSAQTLSRQIDPSGVAVAGLALAQPGVNPAQALKHVRLYRDLQNNWQAHDAYARACLALGTYKMVHAFAYYTIGLLVIELRAPWAGLACALVLPMCAWLIMRLDLYFGNCKYVVGAMLLMLGPLLALIACTCLALKGPLHDANVILVPVIFAMQAVLIMSIAFVAKGENAGERSASLPTRFRSVLYLDVFGWLNSPEEQTTIEAAGSEGSHAPDDSRNAQGTSRDMPVNLRQGLYNEANQLGKQLRIEFGTWALADIDCLPLLLKRLRRLQREFEHTCRDFANVIREDTRSGANSFYTEQDCDWFRPVRSATSEDESAPSCSPEAGDDELSLWVRLEWQPEPPRPGLTWFKQPRTGEEVVDAPTGPDDFVSDLDGIASRIGMLAERVETLESAARRRRQQRGNSRLARVGRSLITPSMARRSVAIPPAPLSARVEPQETLLTALTGSADSSSQSEAQETRFGGREAAEIDAQAHGFMHSETAAQTFHPRRNRRQESRQPPGQVPSLTFFMTSSVLVGVWLLGIFAYEMGPISKLLGTASGADGAHVAMPVSQVLPSLAGAQQLAGSEAWPGRPAPIRALGLACTEHFGPVALIVERFAVHEVSLAAQGASTASRPERSRALDECLGQEPDFLAAGLAGISLECSAPGRCWAMLLGASGKEALACPLGTSGRGTLVSLTDGTLQRSSHFRAIAVASSSRSLARMHEPRPHAGIPQHLWGTANVPGTRQSQLQRLELQRRPGASAASLHAVRRPLQSCGVKQQEAPDTQFDSAGGFLGTAASRAAARRKLAIDEGLRSVHALHALGQSTVLGLSGQAGATLVHAWAGEELRHAGAWLLPEDRQWTGTCSTQGYVFSLGEESADAAGPELWRFNLPAELSSNIFQSSRLM